MSLFRSFATVGSYTLLSRVTGFARDMLQAAFLGAGAMSDAFLIAFQFPNLFRRLFAEGAFSAGFVPIFSSMHEKDGRAPALNFAAQAASVLALTVAVFCAGMIIVMPWVLRIMAPGFDEIPGQMERTTELARIAFPYLFFISLVSLQSGVLNALGNFAAAAAAPILLNLTLIAFLLGAVEAGADRSFWMACGVSVAGVVQFLWLLAACRREGIIISPARPRLTPEVRELLKRMLPVAFGAGIYQLNLLVDKILATLVSVGAVSWLYYADRVNQLPVGVVGVAIGIVLLPLLSRQIGAGNADGAMANQNRAVEVSLLLTLPAAAGIGALAEPITATLFERGRFGITEREAVSAALVAFSSGLPAYVLNKALTPGFFSRHDTATPVKIAIVAFVANVVVSLSLMPFLGHVGIALATSASAWINAGLLTFILRRRGHFHADARLMKRVPRMLIATALMIAVLWGGRILAGNAFGPLFGAPGLAAGPEALRALTLLALIVAGGAVFIIAALALKAAERSDLAQFKRQKQAMS